MLKNNKHIQIVRSTTSGFSSIVAVLTKHFTRVGVTIVNDSSDLEALVETQPDLVFLGMEFIFIEDSLGLSDPSKLWLSDYLDSYGVAYTGSSQLAHDLERHKPLAKQRMQDLGLNTASFFVVKQGQQLVSSDVTLPYPLFIKPTNRGGGLGINSKSVVHNFEQLCSQVESITAQHSSDSLVEEYLPGREFSVAILKDDYSEGYTVMPIELVAPADTNGTRILSDQVKSSNTEQALAVTDKVIRNEICTLALASFQALGARDYGRIDIRLDINGAPHFLEANLIPSLISGYGSFPKACVLNVGLEYEPMITRIADLGLSRNLNDHEESIGTLLLGGQVIGFAKA